jgi:hypothetical protein
MGFHAHQVLRVVLMLNLHKEVIEDRKNFYEFWLPGGK